jgi:hypothetical protein
MNEWKNITKKKITFDKSVTNQSYWYLHVYYFLRQIIFLLVANYYWCEVKHIHWIQGGCLGLWRKWTSKVIMFFLNEEHLEMVCLVLLNDSKT